MAIQTLSRNDSTEVLASNTGEEKQYTRKELFKDAQFAQGFKVLTPNHALGAKQVGVLGFDNKNPNPAWELAQWSSKFDISTSKVSVRGKKYQYANKGKTIFKEYKSNGEVLLSLSVIGKAEYGTRARKSGESWPHLLISQEINDANSVSKYHQLNLNLDVRISKCDFFMEDEFDPGLHCAQTTAYFIIKNLNKNSKDYQDFFWFGIPIFDSRFEFPPESALKDAGQPGASGKLIYVPKGEEILENSLIDGKWGNIRVNMLSYIKKGLEIGKQKGYLKNSQWEDLYITSFNLGWEVTGTYNVGMEIKNLSLNGELPN